MIPIDHVFQKLSASKFRMRFRLGPRERAYLDAKGRAAIRQHAKDFVEKRLAPAEPQNDGKQTPMRGHPVFIAQHATATCCRSCLATWHGIPKSRPLEQADITHIVNVIEWWLDQQAD